MRLFVIAFFVFVSSMCSAATTAPVKIWKFQSHPGGPFSSQSAACSYFQASFTSWLTSKPGPTETSCSYQLDIPNPPWQTDDILIVILACPQGYDLQDGQCVQNDPCIARSAQGAKTGWYANTVGQPSLESNKYCDDGCVVAFNPAPTGTAYTNGKLRLQQYSVVPLGYACTAEGSVPSEVDPKPPVPEKKPPCNASDGVLTSSSGTVACVPEGTPGSAPPNITKEREKKTYSDGSSTETETIKTTDPQTGAQDVRQNVTNTPASNGQQGQAGPPGTSSSEGNNSTSQGGKGDGDNNGKFCAENPTLQICKDGMATEATLKKIADALKWEDPTATDKSPLEKADGEFAKAAEAHEGLIRKIGEDSAASPSFFSWALLPDVPAGACNAFTGNVGGHQLSLDWCDKMGLIRELAGYCFYILTAYGLFAIFTSSTQNGGGK